MRAQQATALIPSIILAIFGGLFVSSRLLRAERLGQEKENEIARGKYLVEEVAKCGECHTPRDASGDLDRQAWLKGAPIWIQPVRPIKNWADRAPTLAGLPGFTEEEAERVLEQGIGPEGETLRPPMHIYHMTHADAKAIVAYLNSLPKPLR